MSNAINRQEVSDYEQELGAWRRLAVSYDAKADAYNKTVESYNTSQQSVPYVTGVQMFNRRDGRYTLSDGRQVSTESMPGLKVGSQYGSALTTARPDPSSIGPAPEAFSGKPPSMTLQDEKNLQKSDTPITDAARAETSSRSVFKPEEGLIARAMKGFK